MKKVGKIINSTSMGESFSHFFDDKANKIVETCEVDLRWQKLAVITITS